MRHSLIIILLLITSCFNSFNDKQRVNRENVEYVEIRKQFDSVSLRLSNDQVDKFISKWNNSNPKGPYKYFYEYFLTIHFKGDSILSYRANQNLIKQRSDWAYSIGAKDYFKTLWFKQAGLPDDYYEYLQTYFKNDKFSQDNNPISEKHRDAIKQVLTYYKHKWIEIRGQIFYQGKIDDELLWNYTTKANDSIWLSSHK